MHPGEFTAGALRWYALYLKSRHENAVELRLREKGIETFLPVIEEVRQYSDRKKIVIEPLFRGYLFVRSDLQKRASILQTDGVVKFVGIGTRPSAIPDRQMEWIRIAGQKPSRIKREPCLSAGERVRVVGGPFAGIEGYIVTVKASMRVAISVECIGQSLSVEVAPEAIIKL